MATLIDGYNLLHAAGFLGRNVGPGTLQRARQALLNFLAASLTESERTDTTVVFDAQQAPPGLPREQSHRGIRVLFAIGHEDADVLLVELIRTDSAPRRLVVVSSDHQIQRAAARRRATVIDSDRWYADVRRERRASQAAAPVEPDRPEPPYTEADAEYWISMFTEWANRKPATPAAAAVESPRQNGGDSEREHLDWANPFPPGYAEDLLMDDEPDGE